MDPKDAILAEVRDRRIVDPVVEWQDLDDVIEEESLTRWVLMRHRYNGLCYLFTFTNYLGGEGKFYHSPNRGAGRLDAVGKHFQHYKGGLYTVVAEAYRASDGAAMVVYRSELKGTVWSRTVENFSAMVQVNGSLVNRFMCVE